MAAPLNYRWIGLAGMSLALVLTACTQVAPTVGVPVAGRAADQQQKQAVDASAAQLQGQTQTQPQTQVTPAATAVAVATSASLPSSLVPLPKTVAVRRGPISQTVALDGRVSGTDESPLSFEQKAMISSVAVKPGDAVTAGQVLVQADTTQIASALSDARDRVTSDQVRIDQAQRLAAATSRQSATNQQDALATATEALRKAQADQATVQAGAPDLEKQTADAAVATASAALQKAQASYSKLVAGASPSEILAAQQAVAVADLAQRQAEADLQKLQKGPDPAEVRNATQQLADAQTAAQAAQAVFDRLNAGPDPFVLRAAQRTVDRAQAALTAANALSSMGDGAPRDSSASSSAESRAAAAANREAAIVSAKLSLQDAQDALTKLKLPPTPDVLAEAKMKVDDANLAAVNAQDKLDKLTKPADPLVIDKATAAVDAANLTLQNSRTKLDQLKASASQDDVNTAQAALQAAQLTLDTAQAKRDSVYGRPTQVELDDAQKKVDTAQTAFARATQGQSSSADSTEQLLNAQQLQKDQQALDRLQGQLDAATLRAPYDGRVVSVQAIQGDSIDPGAPAVVLTRSGDAVVLVTLSGTDPRLAPIAANVNEAVTLSSKVAAGQSASVKIDGGDGSKLGGSVLGVSNGPKAGFRTAQIQLDWGSTAVAYGSTAQVLISVDHKDDALLVPAAAVTTAGDSKYVEYLSGFERKIQPVTVGISTETDAEILSGLSEGQLIVAGTGPSSGATAGPPTAALVATPGALPAGSDATVDTLGTDSSATGASSSGAMLLDERFSTNARGWRSDPQSTAWIEGGVYHLKARTSAQFVSVSAPLPPTSASLADVKVGGTFQKIGGPPGGGYGLIVRDQNPGGEDGRKQSGAYYVFEVGDVGQVGIWRRDQDRWVDILPWTNSNAVHPGTDQPNELSVSVIGNKLNFQVNGIQVASKTDTVLSAGGVGLFAGGDLNEVAVSHFAVQVP